MGLIRVNEGLGLRGVWSPGGVGPPTAPPHSVWYPWAEPQWDHLSLMSLMRITRLMRVCWANEVNELRQANEAQRV